MRSLGHVPSVRPYIGYGSTKWVRILARVVVAKPGSTTQEPVHANIRGWRHFLNVPLAHGEVEIELGGAKYRAKADRGGVLDVVLEANMPAGWHSAKITTKESTEPVDAPFYVVADDARIGLISDIDDTVMVTALPRPLLAAWNTFVLNEHARTPTPGMSVFYERVRAAYPDAPFIYLSTGAWNTAPALRRFLTRNMYPRGPLLLTDWGPTPDRVFRSGAEHKRKNLRRLAREFPHIQWILVGDDGQHDEALYGEFSQERPENVRCVAIRQLSASEAVLAGGRSQERFRERQTRVDWLYGADGAELAKAAREGGVI